MESRSVYVLEEGVQVRREKFGLLFYDYRGPRLYFVPSQDLLEDGFFDGTQCTDAVVETTCRTHGWPQALVRERVGRLLSILEEKGLIHEQPIC
jgi:putative mycofactocin binding protein MftB